MTRRLRWAVPVLLLLSACATGVEMTEDERIACRNEGCAAFIERELRDLVTRALKEGYRRGWTDATTQRSEGI